MPGRTSRSAALWMLDPIQIVDGIAANAAGRGDDTPLKMTFPRCAKRKRARLAEMLSGLG